jgi:DUF1680 family protein
VTFGETPVSIEQSTQYPRDGRGLLNVRPEESRSFGLRIRRPAWCPHVTVAVNGEVQEIGVIDGYMTVDREWSPEGYAPASLAGGRY